jgi:hypothetical protein
VHKVFLKDWMLKEFPYDIFPTGDLIAKSLNLPMFREKIFSWMSDTGNFFQSNLWINSTKKNRARDAATALRKGWTQPLFSKARIESFETPARPTNSSNLTPRTDSATQSSAQDARSPPIFSPG